MEMQQDAKRARCDAPQRSEFTFNGTYIHPVDYSGQEVDWVTYAWDVKHNIRDRISERDFVGLNSMLQDTRNLVNLQNMERVKRHNGRYLSMNVPIPYSIRLYLEAFHNLFLFVLYYLQVYPTKMCSFFDYLLFLMEMTKSLTIQGIVTLDHWMQQDFVVHPEWNWAQHRPETSCTINRVTMDDDLKVKLSTSGHRPAPQNQNHIQHTASGQQKGKGQGRWSRWQSQKIKRRNK